MSRLDVEAPGVQLEYVVGAAKADFAGRTSVIETVALDILTRRDGVFAGIKAYCLIAFFVEQVHEIARSRPATNTIPIGSLSAGLAPQFDELLAVHGVLASDGRVTYDAERQVAFA